MLEKWGNYKTNPFTRAGVTSQYCVRFYIVTNILNSTPFFTSQKKGVQGGLVPTTKKRNIYFLLFMVTINQSEACHLEFIKNG